jgi:hypothetical protein
MSQYGAVPDRLSARAVCIAQEIVRSVVATLGLIAAVPVTTGRAALTFARRPGRSA